MVSLLDNVPADSVDSFIFSIYFILVYTKLFICKCSCVFMYYSL